MKTIYLQLLPTCKSQYLSVRKRTYSTILTSLLIHAMLVNTLNARRINNVVKKIITKHQVNHSLNKGITSLKQNTITIN